MKHKPSDSRRCPLRTLSYRAGHAQTSTTANKKKTEGRFETTEPSQKRRNETVSRISSCPRVRVESRVHTSETHCNSGKSEKNSGNNRGY